MGLEVTNGNREARFSRRGFLFVVAAAFSGIAANAIEPSLKPLFAASANQESSTYLRALRQALLQTNEAVLKNPDSLPSSFPLISFLAADYFSRELGYSPTKYQNRLMFEGDREFAGAGVAISSCDGIGRMLPIGVVGFTPIEGGNPHLNVTRLAFQAPDYTQLISDPVIAIFETGLHELIHDAAAFKKLIDPVSIPGFYNGAQFIASKGAQLVDFNPKNQRPVDPSYLNKPCFTVALNSLEEAIVLDSTARLVDKIGFAVQRSEAADLLRTTYRERVLAPLFEGDHTILRSFQQKSDPLGLLNEVGSRIYQRPDRYSFPTNWHPIQAGAYYLEMMFNPKSPN